MLTPAAVAALLRRTSALLPPRQRALRAPRHTSNTADCVTRETCTSLALQVGVSVHV